MRVYIDRQRWRLRVINISLQITSFFFFFYKSGSEYIYQRFNKNIHISVLVMTREFIMYGILVVFKAIKKHVLKIYLSKLKMIQA